MMKPTAPIVPSLRSTLASKAATLWEARAPLLKFKTLKDLDPLNDEENVFSTQTLVEGLPGSDMQDMEDRLIDSFHSLLHGQLRPGNDLESEDASQRPSTPTALGDWKIVKKRMGVEFYKKEFSLDEKTSEIYKAYVDIECDASRVFSVSFWSLILVSKK
jgi:hypothetical protein